MSSTLNRGNEFTITTSSEAESVSDGWINLSMDLIVTISAVGGGGAGVGAVVVLVSVTKDMTVLGLFLHKFVDVFVFFG